MNKLSGRAVALPLNSPHYPSPTGTLFDSLETSLREPQRKGNFAAPSVNAANEAVTKLVHEMKDEAEAADKSATESYDEKPAKQDDSFMGWIRQMKNEIHNDNPSADPKENSSNGFPRNSDIIVRNYFFVEADSSSWWPDTGDTPQPSPSSSSNNQSVSANWWPDQQKSPSSASIPKRSESESEARNDCKPSATKDLQR